MSVIVRDITEMNRGCRDRLVVNRPHDTGIVDAVRRIVEGRGWIRGRCDEVGYLVHVDPEAVEWHRVMESSYLVGPKALARRVKEVGEVDVAGPDDSHVGDASPFDEDVGLHPSNEGSVRLVHANTCPKDHWHILMTRRTETV